MPKNRKKVLIITYYWPPSGGSGVQRWVKFVKYLRHFGWEPIIYTPLNPEFPEIDNSLAKEIPEGLEIIKTPIWEPYLIYKKFVGLDQSTRLKTGIVQEKTNLSFAKKLSVWIRGNFFIPDARKFWVKPSVKYLSDYLLKKPVDAIVTNGTPHSLHLIGLALKKKNNIPWLADFRDPWTNIDFFDDLMLTGWARKKHYSLEKEVLNTANCITVTSPGTKADFLDLYPKSKIEVITNGFDNSDFEGIDNQPDKNFVIAHIGILTPSRNHPFFWDVLKEIVEEQPQFAKQFTLRLIGSVDASIQKEIEERNLTSYVEHIHQLPHSEIPRELRKARVLLLKIRNAQNQHTIIPGKIFEYLAAKRPIISIGPVGSDSDQILRESKAGKTFSRTEKQQLKEEILQHYSDFKSGIFSNNFENRIHQFSRKMLTEKLTGILNQIS